MRRYGLALCVLLLAAPFVGRTQNAPTEYGVKAVFLFNLTKFVDWPPAAFSDPAAPVRIGIVGQDPFGEVLDETIRKESIRNRKFEVIRLGAGADLKSCHILFVSASERARWNEIEANLRNAPVLTVADFTPFAAEGGMVELAMKESRVQLNVNPKAVERSGLKLSSRLMSLAKIVSESPDHKLP
jgi:hypothetical protein